MLEVVMHTEGADETRVTVLCPDPCLNYECLLAFEQACGEMACEGGGRVVVDLSRARYVDSSGVAALLHLARRLPRERFSVVRCSPALAATLGRCHLDRWVF